MSRFVWPLVVSLLSGGAVGWASGYITTEHRLTKLETQAEFISVQIYMLHKEFRQFREETRVQNSQGADWAYRGDRDSAVVTEQGYTQSE